MAPDYTIQGKICSSCAICAICLVDGPVPDFEGTGLLGLFGLWTY